MTTQETFGCDVGQLPYEGTSGEGTLGASRI